MNPNWRQFKIAELCEIKYGKALKEEIRNEGEIPVYGSNGIIGYHSESFTKNESIIIGRKGSIGEVHYSENPCWPIDTTYYLENESKNLNIKWFYRLLRTLNLNKFNRSAAIPGLNRDDIYRIKVFLPPLDDQIRIATILSCAERLITKRKESIPLLDELLKSTFMEMFGDPVRNEKGWEKKPLSKLGLLDRGVSKHRPRNAPELLGGKYPLIQTGDVANAGTYIKKYTQTYSETGFKQSKLWKAGTLCITIAANIARTGILSFDACFPDSVVGFTANEKEVEIIYIHFLFLFFQRILEKNAPQSAQKNINLDILRKLNVPKPPLPLQNKFAAIVEKVESIKSKYTQSLTELENLYGSLSQRAFKGELDLSRIPVEPFVIPESFEHKMEIPEVTETAAKTFSERELTKHLKEKKEKSFSFEALMDELMNASFEETPEYEQVKSMLFEMLEGKKPFLSQSFDEEKREIVLSVNR